jgi:hypothetical protein
LEEWLLLRRLAITIVIARVRGRGGSLWARDGLGIGIVEDRATCSDRIQRTAEREDGKVRRNEEDRKNGSVLLPCLSRREGEKRVWTEGIASHCLSLWLPVELIIICFFFFIRGWLISEIGWTAKDEDHLGVMAFYLLDAISIYGSIVKEIKAFLLSCLIGWSSQKGFWRHHQNDKREESPKWDLKKVDCFKSNAAEKIKRNCDNWQQQCVFLRQGHEGCIERKSLQRDSCQNSKISVTAAIMPS